MTVSANEFRDRMVRLQQSVASEGLDLFIVTSEENIYYLTGISYKPLERPFFILVRPAGEPEMLVPVMERDHLAKAFSVRLIQTYWDYPSPPGEGWGERLLELTRNSPATGVEPSLPLEIWQVLAGLKPVMLPLIERLRLIKSPAEVEMLRHAARYADSAVERVLRTAYYGVSLLELFSQSRQVQIQMIREVGYDPLLSSVLAGAWPAPGSAMPHDVPPVEARLKEGPHIALSLTRVHGYCAECERTFFLSDPSKEISNAFAAMMEARRRAFAGVRPGVCCAELDSIANGFLRQEGFGEYLLHRTGHGFGLSTHEGPYVAVGSESILAPGMLISIEPGIYFPGIGGVRHSDTILITEDGYEVLTRQPTDLDSMIVRGSKLPKRLMGSLIRRAAGVK